MQLVARLISSFLTLALMSCVWANATLPVLAQADLQKDNIPSIGPDEAKKNLITFVQPDYPALANAAQIAGFVRASIEVDEMGNVRNVRLISGHPMLAPAALQAIRKWKYKPFQVNGKPSLVRTEVQVSIPENIDQAEIDKEKKFQETYWPNERAAREAMGKHDLVTAEAKLLLARDAAEERGDRKWLELASVLSMLGSVKLQQDRFDEAEAFYKDSLAIHEKHQRPDESEVAGAQQQLGFLYVRAGQPEKAEPFLLESVQSYEARMAEVSETPMPEAKAGYGRSLALGYFGLSQIALADGRLQDSRDRCARAVSYAEKWSTASDKDVIVSRCAASISK